jgi:GT2 family glycosyltransferase
MKRVYVLVVNWNGWADTIECLESVFRLDHPDVRVIVCDNDSSDDSLGRLVAWAEGEATASPDRAESSHRHLTEPPVAKPLSYSVYDRTTAEEGGDRSLDPQLTLIRTGGNLGFAGGNNVGLRYAQARGDFDYVWLLNNDTVAEPRALSALIARMAEKPAAGMCGSTLAFYGRPDRVQARGGGWYCKWIGLPWHIGQQERTDRRASSERVEKWMNYVVGASMLVSREFLSEVGLMTEDYFLFFEETDWIQRADSHFTLAYAPQSIVYHKVGSSIGTSSDPRRKSALCDYYAIRNRLLFTRRFHPEALPTVYLSVFVAMLSRLISGRLGLARTVWRLLIGAKVDPPGHGESR